MQITDSKVVLKLEKNTQCSDCTSRCSDGFLGFLFSKNKDEELIVNLNNDVSVSSHLSDEHAFFNAHHQVNDVVGFKFDESQLLKLSLVLYGLPIVLLVLAVICGSLLFNSMQLNVDMGGVLGLVVGLLLAKYLIKNNYFKIRPQVVFFK